MRAPTYSVLLLVVACSSSHNAGPDASSGGKADGPMDSGGSGSADLGSLMPQEIAGNKTAVMATPSVVAITYDNDPNRTDVEAFYHQYAASPAWATQTSEYGVGALTVGTARHLTGAAATTDTAIRQLLMTNLTGATPAWGAPSLNTVYSF